MTDRERDLSDLVVDLTLELKRATGRLEEALSHSETVLKAFDETHGFLKKIMDAAGYTGHPGNIVSAICECVRKSGLPARCAATNIDN